MATTTLTKNINGEQLIAELKALYSVTSEVPTLAGDQLTVEGDFSDEQLGEVVAAHTAIDGYMSPGPAKDWRDKLRAEVAFINDQIATWPTNASTNQEALQRVNFLLSATKRIARNQSRILQFIDNATMDSGA